MPGQDGIDFLKDLQELDNPPTVIMVTAYETFFLSPEQIFYLQADGRYTDIFLTNETRIKTSIHLGKLVEKLLPGNFKRISKSNIINTAFLQKLNHREKICILQAGEKKVELGFSRRYIS